MGQPDYPGGVRLSGNYDAASVPLPEGRKSEIFFANPKTFTTESQFRLQFGFSLYRTISKGNLFTFGSAGKFSAKIMHLPQLDDDTSYIRLQIETDKTYITDFPIVKSNQTMNVWNHLSLEIDFFMQRVIFLLNDLTETKRVLLPLEIKEISLCDRVDDREREIADYCMRELRFSTDEKEYYFPLNQKTGNRTHDIINGAELRLSNIEWLSPMFSEGMTLSAVFPGRFQVPLESELTADGRLVYNSFEGEQIFDPVINEVNPVNSKVRYPKSHGITTELNFEENTLYILNGYERYRVTISDLDENIRPDLGSLNKRNISYDEVNKMIYGVFLGYDKNVTSQNRIEFYMITYSYSIRENKFRLISKKRIHILDFNNTVMLPRFDRNELRFLTFSDYQKDQTLISQTVILISRNKPDPPPESTDLISGVKWYYFLFAGVAAAFIFTVFYIKRSRAGLQGPTQEKKAGNLKKLKVSEIMSAGKENAISMAAAKTGIIPGAPLIRTFGKLELTDIYGNDITQRITGKKREILIYILTRVNLSLNTRYTPEELKSVFFTGLTDEKFNKNLKVYLSNLRNNLKSMKIESLKNDGLQLSDETDFDLCRLNNLIDRFANGMFGHEEAKEMCDILGKGKFLAGEKITGLWLNDLKDEINIRSLNLIRGVINEFPDSYEADLKLRIAHVLSVHAPLSEESLQIKIAIYRDKDNYKAIRSVYDEFARGYRMLTGEKYGRDLTEFLP